MARTPMPSSIEELQELVAQQQEVVDRQRGDDRRARRADLVLPRVEAPDRVAALWLEEREFVR